MDKMPYLVENLTLRSRKLDQTGKGIKPRVGHETQRRFILSLFSHQPARQEPGPLRHHRQRSAHCAAHGVSARRAPERLCVRLAAWACPPWIWACLHFQWPGKFESERNFTAAIEPGHAFLLFPGVGHRTAPDPETDRHEHGIGFDGEIACQWLRHRVCFAKNPVLSIRTESSVQLSHQTEAGAQRSERPLHSAFRSLDLRKQEFDTRFAFSPG